VIAQRLAGEQTGLVSGARTPSSRGVPRRGCFPRPGHDSLRSVV